MNLELDDRPIEHKPSTKLLGVHIDEISDQTSVRAIDNPVYMVSCNMIGRGKTKTKKFSREELGRPKPCARKCERRPYCNAATSQ